jgi:hypothetical protein
MSNDHLVSKTYLKWFQNNPSGKVFCTYYKMANGKPKWMQPIPKDRQQICYEKGRYFRETEETFSSLFEDNWDLIIEHLMQFSFSKFEKSHYKKNEIFNGEQVSLILNFIFTHYKRTKEIKNSNRSNPLVLQSLEVYKKEIGRELREDEIDEYHKMVDNRFVTAPQQSMKFLREGQWTLMVNKNKTPFVTSCSPVLWLDEMKNTGIFTPLSPQFAIFISLGSQKRGIVIEHLQNNDMKKINKFVKENLMRKDSFNQVLISNKKEVLEDIIK